MQRYSVKPVTKREKVLYELLTNNEVSREAILLRYGQTGAETLVDLDGRYNVPLKVIRIRSKITYELLDLERAFEIYTGWVSKRQRHDILYEHVILDWQELGITQVKIAQLYGITPQTVSRIISTHLKNIDNKLSRLKKRTKKLAQVTEKL